MSTTTTHVTISAASQSTGLPVDTIRYYDRLGLLGELRRGSGGVRAVRAGRPRLAADPALPAGDRRCRWSTCGASARSTATASPQPGARCSSVHREAVLERMEQTRRELEVIEGEIAAYASAERAGQQVTDV